MDPRVVAHFGGDLTLANISPRKREAYLNRYAAEGRAAARARADAERRPLRPRRTCSPPAAPGAATPTTSAAGDEHEGFAAGTAWADVPDLVVLPRLRRAREGRLRAGGAQQAR